MWFVFCLCVLYWITSKPWFFKIYILPIFSIFEKWNFHMWCVLCLCVCVSLSLYGLSYVFVSAATRQHLMWPWLPATSTSQRCSCSTNLGPVILPSVSVLVHPWVRLFHWYMLSTSWHHCAVCCLCLETTELVRLFFCSASCVVLPASWADLPTPKSL